MTKRQNSTGKGRVVTSTPKSVKGQNTVTKSAVIAHIMSARQKNLTVGVKAYYDNEGTALLADAIARSFAIPSLTEAGLAKKGKAMSRNPQNSQARRDFAKKNKAKKIAIASVLADRKEGEIIHNRPENNLHGRLALIAKAMGLHPKTFYPVRCEAVREGEVPEVYIVRR